jgi:hypothetical protein
MTSGIDRLVQQTGERLATRGHTRRGFLTRLGVTTAALGTGGLAVGEPEAEARLSNCVDQPAVNVCWRPWKVVAAGGAMMLKAPYPGADPVIGIHNDGTSAPVVIAQDQHVGRQSLRDGGSGCPDPGLRGSANGYFWGYIAGDAAKAGKWNAATIFGRQGWIPETVNGTTYTKEDAGWDAGTCGPAQHDFDCRHGGTDAQKRSFCTEYNGCRTGATFSCADRSGNLTVRTYGDTSEQYYQLRFAPFSTAFAWLAPGDVVAQNCVTPCTVGAGSEVHRFLCVSVVSGRYTGAGTQGFADGLIFPITQC